MDLNEHKVVTENLKNEKKKQPEKIKKAMIALAITVPLTCSPMMSMPVYAHEGSVIKAVYESYTYEDIRKCYDDVLNQITNEQIIINGPGYTKFQKDVAKSRLSRLESKKKVYNELLVIKGSSYTDEQKKYAETTLHDMESKPFQSAWEFGKKLGYRGIELFDYAVSKLLCR